MNHPALAKFQLGKQGLTSGVIEALESTLKNHKQIRISVLKSCCRNREELEKIAEEIKSKLKTNCNYRIIGYTIILIKSRQLSNKNKNSKKNLPAQNPLPRR